ncbi:MAG TPA: hypothetical protein VGJ45_18890 [Pseudonocardiaceae bacterium]
MLARCDRQLLDASRFGDDVQWMVGAIAWASTPGNTGQADRMLAIVLNGLR